jgi:ribonuclease HI
MPKASKGAYYAVRVGRVPGVYTTWCVANLLPHLSRLLTSGFCCRDEAKAQVNGQAGAKHQKFATYEEAHAFVFPGQAGTASASTSTITVASTSGKTTSTKSKVVKASVDVSEDGYVVVYTDGACKDNQGSGPNKRAGLGVWWGAGDPRYAQAHPHEQLHPPSLHLR